MKFLKALKNIQIKRGFTNRQMATSLGIHEITWLNFKSCKYHLSTEVAARAIVVYPELEPLFLSENAYNVSKKLHLQGNLHVNANY